MTSGLVQTASAHGRQKDGRVPRNSRPEGRCCALVSYAPGSDPVEVARQYMQRAEFLSDMSGFDFPWFDHVEGKLLTAAPFSPV